MQEILDVTFDDVTESAITIKINSTDRIVISMIESFYGTKIPTAVNDLIVALIDGTFPDAAADAVVTGVHVALTTKSKEIPIVKIGQINKSILSFLLMIYGGKVNSIVKDLANALLSDNFTATALAALDAVIKANVSKNIVVK